MIKNISIEIEKGFLWLWLEPVAVHYLYIDMSIVKGIIEAHHGSVHIYNQNGAVFEIYLPKIFAKKKL